MAKEKISFKNGSRVCYSIKENNLKDFYDKIINLSVADIENDYVVELRLDYLLNKKINTEDIVLCIDKAKKFLKDKYKFDRQLIATIRNFSCGGNCLLNEKEYLSIVKELYDNSKIDGIDIDFDFYEQKSKSIKKIFNGKKTLIITYTCRDKILSKKEYQDIFKSLIKTPAYILKVVTKAFSRDDADNLMLVANEFEKELKKNKKVIVALSIGKLGIVSKVWYEFTNTMLIYFDDDVEFYSTYINKEVFDKCRKLLSKMDDLKLEKLNDFNVD